MSNKLEFYFSTEDAAFFSKTSVINNSTTNYIAEIFITTPIYSNDGTQIGYKSSNDLIQQIGTFQYLVRINNTYFLPNNSTINWSYSFINTLPNPYYPLGTIAKSTITSGTGTYVNKKGCVSLTPLESGRRNVVITFC